MVGAVVRAPMLVKAGAVSGLLAGLSVGLMVSAPAGIMVGISLGASIGIVAGVVMDREEKRSNERTRHLDDIIGVTSGSLGAPPSVLPPPLDEDREREQELRSWVTEWMTPPPPHPG
jgi:hypothetical protein